MSFSLVVVLFVAALKINNRTYYEVEMCYKFFFIVNIVFQTSRKKMWSYNRTEQNFIHPGIYIQQGDI